MGEKKTGMELGENFGVGLVQRIIEKALQVRKYSRGDTIYIIKSSIFFEDTYDDSWYYSLGSSMDLTRAEAD